MMAGFAGRWADSIGTAGSQIVRTVAETVAETVLADDCPVCETAMHDPSGGVCGSCWQDLAMGRWGHAARVENPGRGIASLTTLGPYEGKLRRLVRAMKFSGLAGAGLPLGKLIGLHFVGNGNAIDGVVAVPLHWRRRWSRGYNQAACVAAGVGAVIGLPLEARGLRRRRSTRTQTGRDRKERIANMREAFVARRDRFKGKRLVLVDDVVTTGATLRACARALLAAGAASVHAAAAARAASPGAPRP